MRRVRKRQYGRNFKGRQKGVEKKKGKEGERRKKERKKAKKREEEQRRVRRRRNIIWKGIEGEDKEKIRMIITRLTRDVTGERKEIRRLEEREGEGGRKEMIAEMESEEDKEKILEMRAELWKK